MFADLFLALYVGHLLADYAFQTDTMVERKADKNAAGWRANIAHSGCHLATSTVLLVVVALTLDLHPSIPACLVALGWVTATHSAIDRRRGITWWMEHTGSPGFIAVGGAAHVDQVAHITLGIMPAALLITVLT